MKNIFLAFLLYLASIESIGQSQILNQYIQQGLESNHALKQQDLEIEKALQSIEIARANIFPKITFSPTYTLAAGGRKLDFPIGDLLNPVYSSLNKLTASNNFPPVENQRIQFAPNNFHETKINFQLPLFNTDIKYNIALQKDLALSQNAKRRLLEYELKYNIEAAYYQYIQSLEALKIYNQSIGFLKDFLAFNQKLVDNKVALKDVVYSASYEISKLESQISDVEKNILTAQAYFNFLLNRDLSSSIELDSSIFNMLPIQEPLATLQDMAMLHRPEFEQIQTGIKTNNTLLKMQEKNAALPTLFLGGSTGFQGFGYSFKDQAYTLGQIGLNWDLYHGNEKKHKIEQTKIQNRILESKTSEVQHQVKMQVAQAWFDMQAALKNLESANRSIEYTTGLLRILENKYKNQSALYIEVLKAQNDHTVAQLTSALARYNIWIKKAQMNKVSGI